MSDLKPCPFCGGEAEVHPSNDWDSHLTGKTFFVWCDSCETRGDYYATEAEAIAAWNTRAEQIAEEAARRLDAMADSKTGITAMQTRGLRFMVRCDFCGQSAEHAWLLFQSADGKNHICNDCVCKMMQAMYGRMED